jgi:hypothetical protein
MKRSFKSITKQEQMDDYYKETAIQNSTADISSKGSLLHRYAFIAWTNSVDPDQMEQMCWLHRYAFICMG